MNIQNSDDARAYELEYPRSESSCRRASIGFLIGLFPSGFIFLAFVIAAISGGLGGGEVIVGFAAVTIMLLIVAVPPFALAYMLGRAESQAGFARRRDHALGIGPPLNFWYGMTGRINRTAYIAGLLAVVVLGIIGIGGAGLIGTVTNIGVLSIVLTGLIIIVLIGITVSLTVRRIHDLGHSGWYAVLAVIAGYLLLVIPIVAPGNGRPNKYGPQPQKFEKNQMALRPSRTSSSDRNGQ